MRPPKNETSGSWILALVVPCILILLILTADSVEGPKTAYVGVLTAVPLFAAIFGTPLMTAVTSVITWISALSFGLIASDGNVTAQTVRLTIIAIAGVIAVFAAYLRQRRDRQFQQAQRTAAEAEFLRIQATHDDLTGVLNRRGLFDQLESDSVDEGTIVVIDCDEFKEVNDTYGHIVGDEFLQGVAGRLSGAVSSEDSIARWGGDEFLLLLRVPLAEGDQVAARVLNEVMSRPMKTKGGLIPVSLSAGTARIDGKTSLDQAIAAADRAMYTAKARGPGQLVSETGT